MRLIKTICFLTVIVGSLCGMQQRFFFKQKKPKKKVEDYQKKLPKADYYLPILHSNYYPCIMWICQGKKNVELRVFQPFLRNLRSGETICFYSNKSGSYVLCKVDYSNAYDTFERALKFEGVKRALPRHDKDEIKKALEVYHSFPGAANEKKYYVVAIGISLIRGKY